MTMISTFLVTCALNHYYLARYYPMTVPSVVDDDIIKLTIPNNIPVLPHLNQYYVGSAEQSFLQIIKDGNINQLMLGKYFAITPCHRTGDIGEYNQEIFLKIELFSITHNYRYLLKDALEFYSEHINCHTIPTAIGEDIVSEDGIELGSYGQRTLIINGETVTYAYGTGLAEPRLSQAINKNNGT